MKLIFSILLILPLQLLAQIQDYQPVLGENNTEWNLLHCSAGGCVTDNFLAVDDTVVNGHHWKFVNGFHFHKKLLIREDTAARKLYFYPLIGIYQDVELPAYDFTLEEGDSMYLYNPLSPVADSAGIFVVDSTRYRQVLNSKRKFIYLSTTDQSSDEYGNPVWVEGAGSLSLIDAPAVEPDSSLFGEITCVYRDGQLIYKSDLAIERDTCLIFTSKSDIPDIKGKIKINIIPNPFKEACTIQFSAPILINKITLLGIDGNLIYTESLSRNTGRIKLPAEILSEGIYFLQIQLESGIYTYRLIRL